MRRVDVLVSGAGLVGLTLAIALARHGLSVAVVDPADPVKVGAPGFDGRVSAIASASWKMFEAIGVAAHLAGKTCPIDRIWVSEGLTGGALDFAPDPEDGALGQMVENRVLRQAIEATAAQTAGLVRFQPDRIVDSSRDAYKVFAHLLDGGDMRSKRV